MTTQEVAEWLGIGDSAISKMEKARTTISIKTIRAVSQLFDLDSDATDTLIRLSKESNERGWWAAYRGTLPEWARQIVSLEGDAQDLWNYESEYVPGLLQTEGYIRALLKATRHDWTDEEIERSITLRLERQNNIDGNHPPKLHFFINEAVLRRPVGDSGAIHEQMTHLIESSKLDHIELRVMPFDAGPHPAMAGAFVMMHFPEEESPAFVYIENPRGAVYLEDPGDVDRYTVAVQHLDNLSLSPEDSREMLSEVLRSSTQ